LSKAWQAVYRFYELFTSYESEEYNPQHANEENFNLGVAHWVAKSCDTYMVVSNGIPTLE